METINKERLIKAKQIAIHFREDPAKFDETRLCVVNAHGGVISIEKISEIFDMLIDGHSFDKFLVFLTEHNIKLRGLPLKK